MSSTTDHIVRAHGREVYLSGLTGPRLGLRPVTDLNRLDAKCPSRRYAVVTHVCHACAFLNTAPLLLIYDTPLCQTKLLLFRFPGLTSLSETVVYLLVLLLLPCCCAMAHTFRCEPLVQWSRVTAMVLMESEIHRIISKLIN